MSIRLADAALEPISERASDVVAVARVPEIAPSGKCGTNQVAIANGIRMPHSLTAFAALAILAVAAVLSASLIVALGPWLARYAVAKPNARSSHKVPTPQGGGIAVVGATIAVSGGVLFFSTAARGSGFSLAVLFCAVLLIAAIGAMADKRPIAPAPRLVLQTFALAAALTTLPPDLRLLPVLPLWSERIVLLIGALWFEPISKLLTAVDPI